MVEITLPIVLQLIQTVALLVGIIYYIMTIRVNQRNQEIALRNQELALIAQEKAEKNRQRDMIIQRSQSYGLEYTSAYMEVNNMTDWETPEEFLDKYGAEVNPEANSKWTYIMRLYEMAGLHLQEGADPEILFELWPVMAVLNLWERFEPVIKYQRERNNAPFMYEPFEYLYKEVKKKYPDVIPSWR